jgi:hypothetical protein
MCYQRGDIYHLQMEIKPFIIHICYDYGISVRCVSIELQNQKKSSEWGIDTNQPKQQKTEHQTYQERTGPEESEGE